MLDIVSVAKHIQGMYSLCLLCMCKFSAIVGLQYVRSVAEISYGALEKVNRGIAALLLICVNKAFSGRLFDNGILIVLFFFVP